MITGFMVFSMNLLFAQEKIRVILNEEAEDDQFKRSLSVLPVYQWTGFEIEPYSRFGAAQPKEHKHLRIKALPDLSACRDTGYTYLYFSGADNALNQGYVLVVIGNFKRSHRTVYFYIDRNNNLDLSDDGPADSLTSKDWETVLRLKNLRLPEAEYRIRISRFKYGENEAYRKLVNEHYQKHSGSKVFTDLIHCYREQRYNTRSGIYRSENDSFRLALKDLNVDGIYNESCVDQMYAGSIQGTIVTENFFEISPDLKKTTFEWNGKKYQVLSIESTGKYIDIIENSRAKLSNKLETGKKVPRFQYLNVMNEKQDLRVYRKKWIYIYFWDRESIEARDTAALRTLVELYGDRLQVIALNHGDDPKKVRIIYFYDKVVWPIGFSTSRIARMYYMEEAPRGYLIRKRFRLVNDRMMPEEVLDYLKKNGWN